MNSGERDELLLKLMLIWLRDNDDEVNLGPFDNIETVGFADEEYDALPSGFDIHSLNNYTDTNLSNLTASLGIRKASAYEKSDVYINGEGYSVKSFSAAPPALVNHTARPGFEFACSHSGVNIEDLDVLVERYWELRIAGQIREDVRNSDPACPFRDERETLTPLLIYFLFVGSGSRVSPFPAEYVLDYNDPLDVTTWRVIGKASAIAEIWDRLIFSIRSTKGMPTNYPNNRNTENNESIALWTKFFQDRHRGALHIRASR
jgi:hypothetical protein